MGFLTRRTFSITIDNCRTRKNGGHLPPLPNALIPKLREKICRRLKNYKPAHKKN